nr:hypothetical protein Itr_chr01CG00270 [Ipomoea trifida]
MAWGRKSSTAEAWRVNENVWQYITRPKEK